MGEEPLKGSIQENAAEEAIVVDVAEILKRGLLEMHFQPITSVRRGNVVGVEALARARNEEGQEVSPLVLFRQAQEQNVAQKLDECCQTLALQAFAPLHRVSPQLLLFVNVDPVSLAELDGERVSFLQDKAHTIGIDPQNVAVEILESRFPNIDGLKLAVAQYRKTGFLVVLDDIGTGDSNLDRITYVQPDIIKADRSLIKGIGRDFYKQEVFKALVQMAERIGGWVITEGIETREDALTALDLGGDLLQGFYLGRPEKLPDGGAAAEATLRKGEKHVRETGIDFKRHSVAKILKERAVRDERLTAVRRVREVLEQIPADETEDVLCRTIAAFPFVESAAVLDDTGVQITDAILARGQFERAKSVFYAPPGKGSSHALKEYFYLLLEVPLHEFESQPYVPLPNTDLCITVSTRYRTQDGAMRILCLHTLIERGVMRSDPMTRLIAADGPEVPRRTDAGLSKV